MFTVSYASRVYHQVTYRTCCTITGTNGSAIHTGSKMYTGITGMCSNIPVVHTGKLILIPVFILVCVPVNWKEFSLLLLAIFGCLAWHPSPIFSSHYVLLNTNVDQVKYQ